jgi:hypothetical protein
MTNKKSNQNTDDDFIITFHGDRIVWYQYGGIIKKRIDIEDEDQRDKERGSFSMPYKPKVKSKKKKGDKI